MLGAATGLLIGTGVAIGSGIFRNPGLVAQHVHTPLGILAAWLIGGLYFVAAGLLVAELATRFPRAGGEYVFLRRVYGDFVAFFFGWAYTVFVIGGGVATMAVAFGDFACELAGIVGSRAWVASFAVLAIGVVTALNLRGLRTGAWTQNALTLAKVAALLAIVVYAALAGRAIAWLDPGPLREAATRRVAGDGLGLTAWLAFVGAALMPVMWCYEGTTDSVKMTEETHDPRRAMPRALVGAGLLVTAVYLLLNWAFLRFFSPGDMAALAEQDRMIPAAILERLLGPAGRAATLVLAMAVVLGAISSAIVSCVRVPFALGRDGLTFRALAYMSAAQAPVVALLAGSGCACLFVLTAVLRADVYRTVLSIYTISTGVLFGLVNLSLLVVRLRERGAATRPREHFHCPAGWLISPLLASTQFAIAVGVAIHEPALAAYTAGLLSVISLLYLIWPKPGAAVT